MNSKNQFTIEYTTNGATHAIMWKMDRPDLEECVTNWCVRSPEDLQSVLAFSLPTLNLYHSS